MKWTENGISFDGTPAEYRELHADGFLQQPIRTRRGKQVIVEVGVNDNVTFQSLIEAAQWLTQKTGRYVSASNLGKLLDEDGHVKLNRFVGIELFDTNNQTKGE